MNSISAAELKRRGMAAIEDGLRHGPVHLMKHNKPAAVVLSETDYLQLSAGSAGKVVGVTAVQWLLNQRPVGKSSKSQLDKALRKEREDWG